MLRAFAPRYYALPRQKPFSLRQMPPRRVYDAYAVYTRQRHDIALFCLRHDDITAAATHAAFMSPAAVAAHVAPLFFTPCRVYASFSADIAAA